MCFSVAYSGFLEGHVQFSVQLQSEEPKKVLFQSHIEHDDSSLGKRPEIWKHRTQTFFRKIFVLDFFYIAVLYFG